MATSKTAALDAARTTRNADTKADRAKARAAAAEKARYTDPESHIGFFSYLLEQAFGPEGEYESVYASLGTPEHGTQIVRETGTGVHALLQWYRDPRMDDKDGFGGPGRDPRVPQAVIEVGNWKPVGDDTAETWTLYRAGFVKAGITLSSLADVGRAIKATKPQPDPPRPRTPRW